MNCSDNDSTTPAALAPGVKTRAGDNSPWLTAEEAAARARCGVKLIYREVRKGKLKAVKLGGRHELRFRAEWIDQWLEASTIAA